jgi:hypothetical protein
MSVGKLFRAAPPPANVAANTIATGSIAPGRTIEGILFKLGGTTFTKAQITLLRIKANGKIICETTGTDLDKLINFRSIISGNAAYLFYNFIEDVGRSFIDEMVGAFDTSQGVANLTYEVTIGGATAPTLAVYTMESQQQAANPLTAAYAGFIHKLLRYPWAINAGGAQNIPLPFGPVNGSLIKRIHILHTGNLTGCTVKENGNIIHDTANSPGGSTGLADEQYLNTFFGKTNGTNLYSIDFIPDGNLSTVFDTRKSASVELVPVFSAADSGYVYAEYLDLLGNL